MNDSVHKSEPAPIKTRPLDPALCIRLTSMERWTSKIADDPDGCHIWMAARDVNGYGVASLPGCQIKARAHRVAWVAAHGVDIPAGLSIDHLCRTRACVNAAHLEAVTMAVNGQRAETASTLNARVTHCPVGHPLDGPDADLVPASARKGQRVCRVCNIERLRTVRAAAKSLGMSCNEYARQFGWSVAVARRVLDGITDSWFANNYEGGER